jgi:hypothetical protein
MGGDFHAPLKDGEDSGSSGSGGEDSQSRLAVLAAQVEYEESVALAMQHGLKLNKLKLELAKARSSAGGGSSRRGRQSTRAESDGLTHDLSAVIDADPPRLDEEALRAHTRAELEEFRRREISVMQEADCKIRAAEQLSTALAAELDHSRRQAAGLQGMVESAATALIQSQIQKTEDEKTLVALCAKTEIIVQARHEAVLTLELERAERSVREDAQGISAARVAEMEEVAEKRHQLFWRSSASGSKAPHVPKWL